ncbi:hypothetical protein GQ457_10G008000 [Hibiscus cannabinus]
MIQTTRASTSGTFLDKFFAIGKNLKTWQEKRRAKSVGRIRILQRLLDKSLQLPPSRIPNCQLVNAKLELERFLRANEIYWAQRSRIQWLANGTTSVLNIAVAYFSGLFTSSSFENPEILNHILPTVTFDMNASLLRPFTADEVVMDFRDIGPGKAPGIDGFPSSFFRLHWDTIGSDVTQLCLDLLHGFADMASINHTIIVLIPKALSALLTAEQYSGGLVGLCASRNGPRINHLLFADDSLIFLRNSANEALRLKHVLHIYGQASGQRVNYDKSAIFFCPKICQQDWDAIYATLGVHEGLFRAFQSLQLGFMWRPGINSVVRIHQECWGGNIPVHLYGDYEDDSELSIRCRHFMIPNCPLWDVRKILAYFSSDDALSILQTPIQGSHIDTLIWYRHDSGIYSVCSGYSFLQRPPAPINRPSGFWKMLAKLPILPKIRTFG